MSAEKIINTPATDGSGLRSDRAANTDRRRSIQSEMDRSPRSVFLLLLLRHFYYELITIVRPALVQLSCVRFMNLVLPSLLFLANKSSVIGLIGWRFFFFFVHLRNTFEFMRHTLHLTTSHGRITVRVRVEEKERKEKTSPEERHVQLPHGIVSN